MSSEIVMSSFLPVSDGYETETGLSFIPLVKYCWHSFFILAFSSVYLRCSDFTRDAVGAIHLRLLMTASATRAMVSRNVSTLLTFCLTNDSKGLTHGVDSFILTRDDLGHEFRHSSLTCNWMPVDASRTRTWSMLGVLTRPCVNCAGWSLQTRASLTTWNLSLCSVSVFVGDIARSWARIPSPAACRLSFLFWRLRQMDVLTMQLLRRQR